MEKTIEEQREIRIIVILNNLKKDINPAYNNQEYQDWLMRNKLDKNIKFRDWVIEDAKKEILKIIDVTKLTPEFKQD